MVRKSLATLALIFLLGMGAGLVLNLRHAPTKRVEGTDHVVQPAEPDVMAEDLELVQGSEGKELWRVRAKRAQYSLGKRLVEVLQPQLSAYVGPDRQEVFIRADSGEVNQAGDTLTLRDNISGRFGRFALVSDEFDYIGAMRKAYFKGRVMVYRPDFEVNATTVEVDLDMRQLTAAGGVSARFTPVERQPIKKGMRP